jgi:hypothetical protein
MRRTNYLCHILLFGFLLGIHEGKIALWKDNQEKPIKVIPYQVSLLPKEDQKALQQGIRIESTRELYQLIEDYLS